MTTSEAACGPLGQADAAIGSETASKLGRAIGMISLSRVDMAAGSGRIGYWTASSCWGQGLTREAFGLVLGLARSIGLTAIRANIAADNVASQRIYQRYGGMVEQEHKGKLTFRIDVSI